MSKAALEEWKFTFEYVYGGKWVYIGPLCVFFTTCGCVLSVIEIQ